LSHTFSFALYIFYSPHYSGRENKRTANTTTQRTKEQIYII